MKNLIAIIFLILTLNVSSQESDINKFRTDRFAVANKINGEWEAFEDWNVMDDAALIVIEGKEKIIFYSRNSASIYDIYDYSTGEEGDDAYVKFITIDGKGKQCTILLTSEIDQDGDHWINMYFFYNTVKIVYSLY